MIVHALLPDGGVVAGDTFARVTAYAYPTSDYARQYSRDPDGTAAAMLRPALSSPGRIGDLEREYHARNWSKLEPYL